MRSNEEFEAVLGLVKFGLNDCQVSRLTGVPQPTVHRMRTSGRVASSNRTALCPRCGGSSLDEAVYAYLLGLYLGDGCLIHGRRDVFRLEIALDLRYPGIIDECVNAVDCVRSVGGRANCRRRIGCAIVYSYWKHWPCLFPQHGPGPKFKRRIELRRWQKEIVARRPQSLLRGLIHSDGCRDLNWVNGTPYPRYQFTNNSDDIKAIFVNSCEEMSLAFTRPYWNRVSISRRADVAYLDSFIGPKR